MELTTNDLHSFTVDETNRVKNPIPLNVGMLRSFSQIIDSKEYFMICELIDNSISSWLGDNYTSKGLIVEVNYTKAKEKNNNRLSVIDNAYGIDEDRIVSALTPGSTDNKTTELNIYGMGLKQAAFWSGDRLVLYTKKEKEQMNKAYIDLDDAEQEKDGAVNFVLDKIVEGKIAFFYEDEWYNHGTIVEISKLRNNRYSTIPNLVKKYKDLSIAKKSPFDSESKKDPIIAAVILKYQRYIQEGMKIIFSITDELNNENNKYYQIDSFDFKIEPEIPYYTISNYAAKKFGLNSQIRLDYNNNFEEYLKQIIKKEIIEKAKLKKNYKEEYLPDYWKLINQRLPLLEKTNLEIPGIMPPVKVNIGYMSFMYETSGKKNYYTRFRGMTVFQKNRAICCGPNELSGNLKKAEIGNFAVKPESSTIRDNDFGLRRIFGSFDIDILLEKGLLSLDANKKNFKENEDSTKKFSKFFNDLVDNFIKKWSPLFKTLEDWLKEEKVIEAEADIIQNNNISNAMLNTKAEVIEDEQGNKFIEINLHDIDVKCSKILKFFIRQISDNADSESISLDYNENLCTINLNVNSHIWKPILPNLDADTKKDAKEKFMQTIYKIVLTQSAASFIIKYGYENKKINETNDYTFLYDKFDEDYISIFNAFSKLLLIK